VEACEPAAAADEAAQRPAVARDVAVGHGEHHRVGAAQPRGGQLGRRDLADRDAVDALDRGLRSGDGRMHIAAHLTHHQHLLRRRAGGPGEGEENPDHQCQLDEHMGSRP
jgi:hypothetical protein